MRFRATTKNPTRNEVSIYHAEDKQTNKYLFVGFFFAVSNFPESINIQRSAYVINDLSLYNLY